MSREFSIEEMRNKDKSVITMKIMKNFVVFCLFVMNVSLNFLLYCYNQGTFDQKREFINFLL